MSSGYLAAMRAERAAVIDFCADFSAEEWAAPSRAEGWSVQDVVAHLATTQRALVTPAALATMRSHDLERLNDEVVAAVRGRSSQQVYGDFVSWSRIGCAALGLSTLPGIERVRLPVGELGRYPLRLMPTIFVYDWHVHLRCDIAPALGRTPPGTDDRRMSAALAWTMALLEQSHRTRLTWLDAPIALTLRGPGGGTWRIEPAGAGGLRVQPGDVTGAATRITGSATEFLSWATRRSPWAEAELTITGDVPVGERFLDTLDLV
ncbi:maleylpyruvate isomerase N-terminal domain-containing protein [Nocardia sp. NPDC088792]|uniref:maleylpyruvate isomerase N-terminal domain-containing protein n=1 Tax=Nocardia sp. NPDC088792 TaxID=3364332 RepID=UPI00381FCD8C